MKRKTIIFTLLVIFLIQAIQLVIWIKRDDSPIGWDQAWHAMVSINRYNQLFDKTSLATPQIEQVYPIFRYANNFYPPLYHISTVPFYALFGTSFNSALLANMLFLLIFIVSSYFIGKKLYSEEAGLVMAFIVSTIPTYNHHIKYYLIDFSLSAMVALGFALLLYTDRFKNLKYSILFGIAFGLGILTKWSYPMYLVVLIFFALFSKNVYKEMSRLRNIFLSFLSAGLISSYIWYTPTQIKIMMPRLLRNVSGIQGTLEGDPVFSSLKGLVHYLSIIINEYSFIYTMVFLTSLIPLIRYYRENRTWCPVLYNFLGIYAMCTLVANKDPRYILPIYTFLAAMTVIGIGSIKRKKIKYVIMVVIVVLGLFQNISYNSEAINVDYGIGKISFYNSKGAYPFRSETDISKILSAINDSNKGRYFSACIIAETGSLNDSNIPYYAMRGNYPVSYMVGNGCNPLKFDYTIVGPIHETWRSNLFEHSKSILNDNLSHFKLIYLDDGIRVYQLIK